MSDLEYLDLRVRYKYENTIIKNLPQAIFVYLMKNPHLDTFYLSSDIQMNDLLKHIATSDKELLEAVIDYVEPF